MLKAFSRVLLGFLTDQPVEGAERRGGSAAKCNDDLLIGNGRAVAAGENAFRRSGAVRVDHDFAPLGELNRALEEVRIGHKTNLHEAASGRNRTQFARGALAVGDAGQHRAVAFELLNVEVVDDLGVRSGFKTLHENFVRSELAAALPQRDGAAERGKVNRRLNAGIAAAYNDNVLALEERTVAVRAVGDAVALVFLFTRNAELAPAGPAPTTRMSKGALAESFSA